MQCDYCNLYYRPSLGHKCKKRINRGINWYRTNTKAGDQMACIFGIEAPCDECRMCENVQAGNSEEE